jgi:hypothetical protein
MLEDDFIDMEESCEGMWLRAWRCLNCGHATDSVMVASRQLHAVLLTSPVQHEDHLVEEDSRTLASLAA